MVKIPHFKVKNCGFSSIDAKDVCIIRHSGLQFCLQAAFSKKGINRRMKKRIK